MPSIKQLLISNLEAKRRLWSVTKKYGIILVIGIAYLIWVLLTDLRIPCIIYELTGLKCPGCGVTRMIVSAARLDIASAFGYNPFIFITGPIILIYIAVSEIKFVICGNGNLGRWEIIVYAELVLAFIYCILRNLYPI